MSDKIVSKNSTASFHRYNWRKELNTKANYNCPCRGNKPPYTVKKSLLDHYKTKHPQQYESLKETLTERRRRSHGNQQASSIEDSNNNAYGSSSHMVSDSDNQEIQIIFEHPDTSIYEDLEERDEIPNNTTYVRAEREAKNVEKTYRGDYTSDSETEEDLDKSQYVQDMQQYVNTIAPVSSMINQAEEGGNEESSLQNIRQATDTQNEEL